MALDPYINLVKGSMGTNMRMAQRIADLENRVSSLERSKPAIQVVAGQPSNTAREGTAAADGTNTRLWVYLNGAWHYTGLT